MRNFEVEFRGDPLLKALGVVYLHEFIETKKRKKVKINKKNKKKFLSQSRGEFMSLAIGEFTLFIRALQTSLLKTKLFA